MIKKERKKQSDGDMLSSSVAIRKASQVWRCLQSPLTQCPFAQRMHSTQETLRHFLIDSQKNNPFNARTPS